MEHTAGVYLITGPMAAGKSTVARLLASRFDRGVHLEGDVFRRSIVSGREDMAPSPSESALEQLRLRYRLAAAAADTYAEAGFTVALEDVVAGPLLQDYRTLIRSRPCHVVVLVPSVEAIAAREAGRAAKGYGTWTIDELRDGFVSGTPRIGVWIDTTHMTPDETVDEILAGTAPVVIVDYDAQWPTIFEIVAQPIRTAVADLGARVEHVGGTAVPGLAAKPIIDIDVLVPSTADIPAAITLLRGLGYVHRGDQGVPGREAFAGRGDGPAHHLYVVAEGSSPAVAHLSLRDRLRRHPELVREYAALKRRLAAWYGDDRRAYTDAKTEFIARVLRSAG